MGCSICCGWNKTAKAANVMMVGLDNAGKTTILKLLRNENLNQVMLPTIGFNVDHLKFKGLDMTLWDVGGQYNLRHLWKHYYRKCQAVVFVVDAADRDRLIHKCKEDENSVSFWMNQVSKSPALKDAIILVLANKQDQRGALSTNQIIDALDLCTVLRTKHWHVAPAVAINNEGISEAFHWLNLELQNRIK